MIMYEGSSETELQCDSWLWKNIESLHWTCSFIWTFSSHPSIHPQIWVRIFHYPMHVHIYCLITLCRQPPQVLQCGETWRAQVNQPRRTTVNHVSKSLSQQRQGFISYSLTSAHLFCFFGTWLPGWSCKLRILLSGLGRSSIPRPHRTAQVRCCSLVYSPL